MLQFASVCSKWMQLIDFVFCFYFFYTKRSEKKTTPHTKIKMLKSWTECGCSRLWKSELTHAVPTVAMACFYFFIFYLVGRPAVKNTFNQIYWKWNGLNVHVSKCETHRGPHRMHSIEGHFCSINILWPRLAWTVTHRLSIYICSIYVITSSSHIHWSHIKYWFHSLFFFFRWLTIVFM